MRRILIVSIILIGLGIGGAILFLGRGEPEISGESSLENLGSIISKNTNFKNFNLDSISFKYPDWQEIKINPGLIWPKEIAEKQEILLYLVNLDGAKMVMTRRRVATEDLAKPFPLVFRKVLEEERQIMEEKGGLTYYQITGAEIFDNEITLEARTVVLGNTVDSISKSFVLQGYLYSIGISASERIFGDYHLLAKYTIDSIKIY